MIKKSFIVSLIAAIFMGLSISNTPAATDLGLNRDFKTEMIYFAMIDRFSNGNTKNDLGGYKDARTTSGYDPYDTAFYHGGDIQGLSDKLEYIKSLGFTALWITPVFRNIPVGVDGKSAAYHGYAIAGFDQVDSHLGTMAEFKAFVVKAHSLGLKVVLDIVVNHTADVISYKENYDYIYLSEKPYKTSNGKAFDIVKLAGTSKFPAVTQLSAKISFPKTPVVSKAMANIKSPAWLNDVRLYHNRGKSTFQGESGRFGDFYGFDDIMTESPEVVKGFIDLYSKWISTTGIDGFRIDTARHVNEAFWQAFIPSIRAQALAFGKKDFPMWGEVYDSSPETLDYWARYGGFTELLDFPVQDRMLKFITAGSADQLATLLNEDDQYSTATIDPRNFGVFLGNHDMGRIGGFIGGNVNSEAALLRDQMAHALLFTMRGVPIVYYGDEFGLMGDSDKEARQDLFVTLVDRWRKQQRIGGEPIGMGKSSFDTTNPLQQTMRDLTKLHASSSAFSAGAMKIRIADNGLLVFSRFDLDSGREYLMTFNSSDAALTGSFDSQFLANKWEKVLGDGLVNVGDKTMKITVPAYGWGVFLSDMVKSSSTPEVTMAKPVMNPILRDRFNLEATISGADIAEVQFQYKDGTTWKSLGTDTSPTFKSETDAAGRYRVFPLISDIKWSSNTEFRAVAFFAHGVEAKSESFSFMKP